MKKLITMLLILAILLPAAALAEDNYRIVKHYALLIDSHAGDAVPPKGGSYFDFDSLTLDLFLASDDKTGYIIETQCISGIFFNNGMKKVTLVEMNGNTYLVDDAGNHINLQTDENGDLWIDFGIGYYFRMRPVDHVSVYKDRK